MRNEVIEFMGMPKAGKTTQISNIRKMLAKKEGIFPQVYTSAAQNLPFDKDDYGRFVFNMFSAYAMTGSLVSFHPVAIEKRKVMLIDRGIYDHMAFSIALHDAGLVTTSQHSATMEFLTCFLPLETKAVLFNLPPEEAMKREHKHCPHNGRVMNLGFLGLLSRAYEKILPVIEGDEKERIIIDGSRPLDEATGMIFDFICNRNCYSRNLQ